MSKTMKNIITVITLALVLILCIVFSVINTLHKRIPQGTIGNTAGNLNNNGLFCESDGMVYFANPYDNNSLYSMKADGTELKCLNNMSVKFINAGGNYVFFFGKPSHVTSGLGSVISKPGLFQIEKSGKNLKALSNDVTQNMVLVDNTIYYQHHAEPEGTTFYKMNIKKQKATELLSHMVNPSGYFQGKIYYNGTTSDHSLYAFDLETETEMRIWNYNLWNPVFDGNNVYFMDMENNYRLCKYNIPNDIFEVLSSERVEFFNLYGEVIYYQTNSKEGSALKRMRTDGTVKEIVAEGIYSEVNITSEYAYFSPFGADYPLYRTPTYGSVNVEEFMQAQLAAIERLKK